MAIDSREKRQAIATLGRSWAGPNVTPLDIGDAEWREEVAVSYPLTAQIAAAEGGDSRRARGRSRSR